jgi:hypothetical protein
MSEQEKMFGSFELQGKDVSSLDHPYDRLAASGRGELLLLSFVAATQSIKQIRAVLCNPKSKVVVNASGAKINQPSRAAYYAHQPGKMTPSSDGYFCFTHKLDYGQAHALFMTKSPGFMPVVNEESLWQELNDVRFTTPILRQWMPYIEQELRKQELLEEAHVFNCACGVLSAQTKHLDVIVSDGLSSGAITIPSES